MSYTGVRVIEVRPDLIDQLYTEKSIDIDFDARKEPFNENEYVILKDINQGSQSALSRVKKGRLVLLNRYHKEAAGIKPRNSEQRLALDALRDPEIRVVVLTGRAGTGKTLLTLAAALQEMEEKAYNRIILTRSMSWVGRHSLGALPGDVDEKFGPYLQNYMSNIECLLGGRYKCVEDLISQYRMDFIPIQLIRGASWANSFIIADEVQVLGYDEMVALGTRVGEGSKLVIMGDLGQRDENITREKTGIYKFINDPRTKKSPLVASIELIKCERSEVATLFADVFER